MILPAIIALLLSLHVTMVHSLRNKAGSVRCNVAAARLQPNITNFDKYPIYFHEDSVMTFAQGGDFVGPDDIQELVRFATDSSAFVAQGPRVVDETLVYVDYDRNTDTCIFLGFFNYGYQTDPKTTLYAADFQVVSMTKFFLKPKELYIEKAYVYYTIPFLQMFVGGLLNSDNTRKFICSVMTGPCHDIVSPTTPKKCKDELKTLPIAEGSSLYVDGDSQGCRTLHATYAMTYPVDHCPHISFEPLADPIGRIRCQTSAATPISDLFQQDDLTMYTNYLVSQGIDPILGYTEPVCVGGPCP